MTDPHPPIDPPILGSEATDPSFYTFDAVEEAMIDAMLLWRRAPDRERGWMAVRSLWPDIRRPGSEEHWWGIGDGELNLKPEDRPEPRPLPLTRAEVAEMNRVGEWLGLVAEQDRKVVVLAVVALASGKKRGAGALAQRYERAVGVIAFRLNGRSEAEALRLVQRRGDGWQDVIGRNGSSHDSR